MTGSEERVALGLYDLMGGKPENWARETDAFRSEYRRVARLTLESPTTEPISDHCSNCGEVVLGLGAQRFDCPCDVDGCTLGFVCRSCNNAIRRNTAREQS